MLSTYPRSSGHYSVGEDKQVQANQLEDVFEEVDDLQGQHVLGSQGEPGRQAAPPLNTPPQPIKGGACVWRTLSPTLQLKLRGLSQD